MTNLPLTKEGYNALMTIVERVAKQKSAFPVPWAMTSCRLHKLRNFSSHILFGTMVFLMKSLAIAIVSSPVAFGSACVAYWSQKP